jgi:hypothetical protein
MKKIQSTAYFYGNHGMEPLVTLLALTARGSG